MKLNVEYDLRINISNIESEIANFAEEGKKIHQAVLENHNYWKLTCTISFSLSEIFFFLHIKFLILLSLNLT